MEQGYLDWSRLLRLLGKDATVLNGLTLKGRVHGSGVSAFRLNRPGNVFRGLLEPDFVAGSCGLVSGIACVDDVGFDHGSAVISDEL